MKTNGAAQYQRGRAFEYQVRDNLAAKGFLVLRSPGSKSPFDIMALRKGECWLVQCKRDGSLPPDEWNELYILAQQHQAAAILASRAGPRHVLYERLTNTKIDGRSAQPKVTLCVEG